MRMQLRRYIDIIKAVPPVTKEYIMRNSIILPDTSMQVEKGNDNLSSEKGGHFLLCFLDG